MSDAIGGNAKTQMIVTVLSTDFLETQSSLTFATKMKKVCNRQAKNIETAQIKQLKNQLKQLQSDNASPAGLDVWAGIIYSCWNTG